jgi:spermidine synthase
MVSRREGVPMKETILYQAPGRVHNVVQVVQRGNTRYLRFGAGGGWQGAIRLDRPDCPVFPYQRAFLALTRSLMPDMVRNFAALGVGTGTALRTVARIHPHCRLHGIEVEERVVEVAKAYFGAPQNALYQIADAVHHLASPGESFDLVFVDLYSKNRIYEPCLQPEFAEILRHRTTRGGAVACNLIFPPVRPGPVRDFIEALCTMFGRVMQLPVGVPWSEQNVLVIAGGPDHLTSSMRRAILDEPCLRAWERWSWPLRLREVHAFRML